MKHGEELFCSYKACRNGGVKFRFCSVCQVPVAKRNFRQRHMHGIDSEKQLKADASMTYDEDEDVSERASVPLRSKLHELSQVNMEAPSRKLLSAKANAKLDQASDNAKETAAAETRRNPRETNNSELSKQQSTHEKAAEEEENQETASDGSSSLSSDRDNGMHRISELSESTSNNGDRESSSSGATDGAAQVEMMRSAEHEGRSPAAPPKAKKQRTEKHSVPRNRPEACKVNEWLSLLWERPASTDYEGMSQWMERVREVSRFSSPSSSDNWESEGSSQENEKKTATGNKESSCSDSGSSNTNIRKSDAQKAYSAIASLTNSSLSSHSREQAPQAGNNVSAENTKRFFASHGGGYNNTEAPDAKQVGRSCEKMISSSSSPSEQEHLRGVGDSQSGGVIQSSSHNHTASKNSAGRNTSDGQATLPTMISNSSANSQATLFFHSQC